MLFRDLIVFSCENYTKHKYTIWTNCLVVLILKQVVNGVTTVLDRNKIYVTEEWVDSTINNADAYKKECFE